MEIVTIEQSSILNITMFPTEITIQKSKCLDSFATLLYETNTNQ
jgi:hypothetical protein